MMQSLLADMELSNNFINVSEPTDTDNGFAVSI